MANQVMTVLEGKVGAERWAELDQRFAQLGGQRPAQLVQSFLAQSEADPTIWRLIAVWQSRQALDEYRAAAPTPGGVLLFRSLGVEPAMAIFEIKGRQGG
jgi:quinol monooxygenase YgiN